METDQIWPFQSEQPINCNSSSIGSSGRCCDDCVCCWAPLAPDDVDDDDDDGINEVDCLDRGPLLSTAKGCIAQGMPSLSALSGLTEGSIDKAQETDRRLESPDFLNRQPSTDLMQFSMNLIILWSPSRFRDTSSRRTSTAVQAKEKKYSFIQLDRN